MFGESVIVELLTTQIPCAGSPFSIGKATLNSERTLNSLTFEMLDALQNKLLEWNDSPSICAIVLEGAGTRAFCAGGNIKKLQSEILQRQKFGIDENSFAFKFFLKEYSTDYLMHKLKKPCVVWAHGITMGGGLGLIQGASFKVVTSQTIMAMPEISIGLYPDVGAFYFLKNLKIPGLGLFMALTGARVSGYDCVISGLASHYLDDHSRNPFIHGLMQVKWDHDSDADQTEIDKVLNGLLIKSEKPSVFTNEVLDRLKKWDKIESLSDLIKDFKTNFYLLSDWEKESLGFLLKGSPTSVAVTFKRFKQSQDTNPLNALENDLAMSMQFAKGSDFVEGVRALILDKDLDPKWNPTVIEKIPQESLDFHFHNPFEKRRPLKEKLNQMGIESC